MRIFNIKSCIGLNNFFARFCVAKFFKGSVKHFDDAPLCFARSSQGDANGNLKYHGLLDDVSVWDTELSEEEVKSLMYKRLRGNEKNLIGYW
jgi:hypothetical protein